MILDEVMAGLYKVLLRYLKLDTILESFHLQELLVPGSLLMRENRTIHLVYGEDLRASEE